MLRKILLRDIAEHPLLLRGEEAWDRVLRLLADAPDGALLVVDGRGRVRGRVRQADALRSLREGHRPPLSELMTPACCLSGDLPVLEVGRRLAPQDFPLALVSPEGVLEGVVSQDALWRAYRRDSEVLQRSLTTLLDAVSSGIVAVDQEGVIRAYNAEAERLIGVPAARALGRPLSEVLPGVDLGVLREGEPQVGRREELGGRPVLSTTRPVVLDDGRRVGAVKVFSDLSELERLLGEARGLRSALRTLEMVFEHAFEGIVVVDRQGIIRYVNERGAAIFDREKRDLIGRHISELTHQETRLPLVLETGRAERGGVIRWKGRDLVVDRIPILEDGQVVGAVGVVLFKDLGELQRLAQQLHLLKARVDFYRQELRSAYSYKYTFANIVGQAPAFVEAKQKALKAAKTSLPVLLVGESGTGKELFAHAIHHASYRREGDFVGVNCAAIPAELLETELFGYEPGAFTGARSKGKPGKFELADGGTLFLDEIADMPPHMQAKLLRALQEKEIERVGATRPRRVDFRLICATHEEPEELVATGRLREDLFYRISVIRIDIPPLREREGDVMLLAEHFLQRIGQEQARSLRLSEEAKRALLAHSWPGNVRELLNVLEAASSVAEGDVIGLEDLPSHLRPLRGGGELPTLRDTLLERERETVLAAIRAVGGNMTRAARLLGIHRTGLYKKLRRLGLHNHPELRRLRKV